LGESASLYFPNGVPIAIGVTLIGNLRIVEPANGIGIEKESVPTVIKSIENDGEVVVIEDIAVVPPHLIRHDPLGVAVPTASSDVDIVFVEEYPDLGPLGCRLSFSGLLLDKSVDRRDSTIGALFELAVDV
jgi:hypothetical protein